ncbi:MAG: hypothetical protein J0H49_08670 [Acidobacteria bacterium]|nr:hypothetical protein [Acidobacteriota bacterium]
MRVDNSSHSLTRFLETGASQTAGRASTYRSQSTDFGAELAVSRQAASRAGAPPRDPSTVTRHAETVRPPEECSVPEPGVPEPGTSEPAASSKETAAASAPKAGETPAAEQSKSMAAMTTAQGELDPSPAAPWPMTLVTPTNPPALAADTKSALAVALTKAGIDPATVKVSYWEELVWFPGGNWINRSITVQTPNGQKMDFDAAATLRSPYVTANSVQEMLNV